MTGYSSRSDQLWSIAQQLVEEEIKSIPFAQQEEHGQRIQTKYNQLVNNLSCLGKIIAEMYQEKKLTPKEYEQIQHLQSTPIRAIEELLSIIANKPRDVFECFLSLTKDTNQLHLYQMLVSGDDTCDKARGEGVSSHKDLIRRNFVWLSDKLETENGLISLLYQQNVLTVREREDIFSTNNIIRRSELLLGLLSKKSPEDFDKFLKTLEVSGQGHLAKKLSKPEGSPDEIATDPSAALTPKIINHQPLPNDIHKSRQKPVPVRSYSKPVPPPQRLPKSGQKLIPSRFLSKPDPPPKPGTQSISAQHYTKPMHTVAKTTEKAINFQRAEVVKFQTKLEELVSRLKTDIAVKVTDVSLLYFEKPEDNLKIFFHILLQECLQMRKEIVARNVEANKELEQLRKSASQHSAAATLNEVVRTQLQSTQQELSSERLQNKKERMQLEEKIHKLKADNHNDKLKCKRFEEEKLLSNTVIMELKDTLSKAECDIQSYQKQIDDLNKHLASTAYELQNSKDNFKESNTEIILLRTERETFKEACEILRKESEITNDLKVQLLHTQENSRDLVTQLKEKDRSLKLLEEENLELTKEIEDRLKKGEREKQFLQQQMHELKDSLASTEYELQNAKLNFEKSNTGMISLRIESDKLKEAYEILMKENETRRNDREVQLPHTQENDRYILTRFKEKDRSLEDKLFEKERSLEKERKLEKESSLKLAEEEILELIKPQKDAVEEKSPESDRILKLDDELKIKRPQWQELEDSYATAQLKRPSRKREGRYITFATKDELPEKYKSDPDIIGTIRATAAKAACNSITGLTILEKELFVVCEESSEIEVCDSIKLSFSGRWNLTELIDPKDIVSCNINKCLYIFDFKGIGLSKEILRVDPNGNLIKKWSTGDEYGCSLSVTYKSNVILTVYNKNKLNEYSPDGLLFREIYLSSEAGRPILYPFHAIELTNGHFVVSHSSHGDDLHRVCIVDADGKLKNSFGGKRGSTIEQMKKPVHLSVDGNGFVMVTDQGNIRVLLLDSNLEFKREILSAEKHGLQCPLRIFPDESNGRLFVADNEFDIGGRMLIFKFCA